MSASAGSGAALRRAALTLHALPEADCEWVLTGLAPAQREAVTPLLADLRELGIPRDGTLLAGILSEQHRPSPQRKEPVWLEHLEGPEVTALARVLSAEPAALTRSLLAMQPWSWTQELLPALDGACRCELERMGRGTPPPARVQSALLEALRPRVEAERRCSAPMAQSRWQWIRRKFASLGAPA
jgi:hypothetical protein